MSIAPPSSLAPLMALQAASQALARARVDEQGILAHLQTQIRELFPPGRIHVMLFRADSSELHAWNAQGEELPPSYFDTHAAQGLVGWLRETRESLLVGDFQRDWETLPAKPTYENPDPPVSAIFAPLVVADEAFGAVSIQSDKADAYTPDHLWQLKILSNQAAAALHASRLLASERTRANQLETLGEITRSVVSILDLDVLLSQVVDIIQAAFGYYHVQVFVVEKDSDRAFFRASSGDETHDLWRKIGRSVHIGSEGIIGWVAGHGESHVADDVALDPLYIPDDPRLLPHTRSEVAVPLRLNDEVLGVLDVQSDRPHAFNADDLAILGTLADAVALAVANARLYRRVQEDAWITIALLEVADATNRLTELDEVIDVILRITPLLTGVTTCAVWLRQPNDNALHLLGQRGLHEEMLPILYKTPLLADDNPAIGLLERSLLPVVLKAQQLDEMLQPMVAQALLAEAVTMLPLQAKGELIGALAVGFEEASIWFSETRVQLLTGIANQAASAIENVQLIAAQREEAWVSTALLQVAEAMGRAGDLSETLGIVARLATTFSGFDRCTIFLRQPQTESMISSISYSSRRDFAALPTGYTLLVSQAPLFAQMIDTRQPVCLADTRNAELIPADVGELLGYGALASVPLIANDEVVGVLLVQDESAAKAQSHRLLDILLGIANQAAVAIERARLQHAEVERQRIVTELAVARTIQEGFLPDSVPILPGYEIAAVWEPAREIAGDFYDFIPLVDNRLGIVVADVADKGVPAALFMALSRTTLRFIAGQTLSPAVALRKTNTAIVDTSFSDMFVTMFYAVLDPRTHRLNYASGGHGLAFRCDEEGPNFLRGRGMPLGILPNNPIEEKSIVLAPGDCVILYTDGITEAFNAEYALYGEPRLTALVEQHRQASAPVMLEAIRQDVLAWRGDAPRADDFTLVILRRLQNDS